MGDRTPPRILLVEDNPDTAIQIQEALEIHFGPGCVRHGATIARALSAPLAAVDMVLSDMNLPDGDGLDLLKKLLKRRADLPIVLITAEGVLENALHALSEGAYDYILKSGDYLFALPIVVEKNLAIWRTRQENLRLHQQLSNSLEEIRVKNEQLEAAIKKLESMASTDPLTALANRRAFNQAMERRFAEACRYDHDLACIMIDLDGFKMLNDSLGHQAGDDLLKRTGRILEANCRRSDMAGRFGGDEFIILLPETDLNTARVVAERIKQEFENTTAALLAQVPRHVAVTMSMGVASLRQSRPTTPEQLIGHADDALYRAKQAGKQRIAIHSPPPPREPSIAAIGA